MRAGLRAREVTRGLLALRSSSGLGVPTSCKRAGEEAAATGAGLPWVTGEVVLYASAGSPRPGDSLVVLGLAAPGPVTAGYAAMAAVWLMVPAATRWSQEARLVTTL